MSTARRLARVLVAASCMLGATLGAGAGQLNGFDLSGALVPESEIRAGGPPRDGIPAIDRPRFVGAAQARFLAPEDRVLGVVRNGHAKAYPIRILNWHEIVNDRFGSEPVMVSYCPLCGTGMAYRARVAGDALDFGVSGLLYNSDVLFYDRKTGSLWSQVLAQAISGPLKGSRLTTIPVAHTNWSDWRSRHPDTLVLSTETGYARDYDRDPYAGYESSRETLFPVRHTSERFHAKETVLGIEVDGLYKAYPFSELAKTAGPVTERIGARRLTITFDAAHRSASVRDEMGDELPAITGYWFAWFAFHPDTEVYVAP